MNFLARALVLSLKCLFIASGLVCATPCLISPADLKAGIASGEDLVIVDVSCEPEDYANGHLPGAIHVCWKADLSDGQEFYYRVPSKAQFEAVMSRIGATPDSRLVFYDNRENRMAIRGLWVAEFYGHRNAAILEGGADAWRRAGYPLTKKVPTPTATAYRAARSESQMNVEYAWVHANLRNEGVHFVDSRPFAMFTGETQGLMIDKDREVARLGHLPNATNLPWKKNLAAQASFLDVQALKDLYSQMGITPDKLTVFYCNEGLHAAFNWFVASKLLGNENVKIYEGSMGEWASDPKRPMVSGVGF